MFKFCNVPHVRPEASDSFELELHIVVSCLMRGQDLNLGPLHDQYILLTFELSLQPGIMERCSKLNIVIPWSRTNSSQVIIQSVGLRDRAWAFGQNLIVFCFCLIKNQTVWVQQVRTVPAGTVGCTMPVPREAQVDSVSMNLICILWTLLLFPWHFSFSAPWSLSLFQLMSMWIPHPRWAISEGTSRFSSSCHECQYLLMYIPGASAEPGIGLVTMQESQLPWWKSSFSMEMALLVGGQGRKFCGQKKGSSG